MKVIRCDFNDNPENDVVIEENLTREQAKILALEKNQLLGLKEYYIYLIVEDNYKLKNQKK